MAHRRKPEPHRPPRPPKPPIVTTTTTTTPRPSDAPLATWQVLLTIVPRTDLPGGAPYTMSDVMLANARLYADRFARDIDLLTNHRLRIAPTIHECQAVARASAPAYNGQVLSGTNLLDLLAQDGVDAGPYDGFIAITPKMDGSFYGDAMGLTWAQVDLNRNGGYSWAGIGDGPGWGTDILWGLLDHEFTHQAMMWYSRFTPNLLDIDNRMAYTWPDGRAIADGTWQDPTKDFLYAVYTDQCVGVADGRRYGMTDADWRNNPAPRHSGHLLLPPQRLPAHTVTLARP